MITELVCPQFYVEEWEREGRRFTELTVVRDKPVEFQRAADDGVCRLLWTERSDSGPTFVCRCGVKFKAADAKQVELR